MSIFDLFSNRENSQNSTIKKRNLSQDMLNEFHSNVQQDFGEYAKKESEIEAFLTVMEKEIKRHAKKQEIPKGEEEPPAIDARAFLHVSEDLMTAYACILPPFHGGAPIGRESLLEDMRYEGIAFGIDQSEVERMISEEQYLRIIKIANGVKPQDGKGGSVEELYERKHLQSLDIPKDASLASMDLKKDIQIQPIHKGDVICRITPSTPPQDGTDIAGRTLPGKTSENVHIPAGKNTSLLQKGTLLLAAVDGIVVTEGDDFSVIAQDIIEKDIDASAGNLSFAGNVFIRGNIEENAVIKAAGNIIIEGEVHGGNITSDGTIRVCYGVTGTSRTELTAKRQIQSPVIENAAVTAQGNIYAGVIANSNINSLKGSVYAMFDRGIIFGGHIRVKESVFARKIGNLSGCITKIMLGYVPELTKKESDLEQELEKVKETLEKLKKNISAVQAAGIHHHRDKQESYAKLIEQRTLYDELGRKKAKELKELKRTIYEQRTGKVSCEEVYPVTEIYIGSQKAIIQKDEKNCSIHLYAGSITLR